MKRIEKIESMLEDLLDILTEDSLFVGNSYTALLDLRADLVEHRTNFEKARENEQTTD